MSRISVIVPVVDEPDLNAFLHLLYARFAWAIYEVIVVDGDPKGRSIAAVDRGDVITLVSQGGRGPQMNAGARVATGEILLFLHADTRLPDRAFHRIQEALATERYAAGAFTLGFENEKKIFALIARAAALRCRLTRIPYGDQALFMGRAFFLRLGGFKEIPVMEDIELMRRIRKNGGRVHILSETVKTSTRRWEKEGVLFCLARTWVLSTLFRWGVAPVRLARYYRPHSS